METETLLFHLLSVIDLGETTTHAPNTYYYEKYSVFTKFVLATSPRRTRLYCLKTMCEEAAQRR